MMNRISLTIIATLLMGAGYLFAKPEDYFGAKFLSAIEAKKRWGSKEFDPTNFKKRTENEKSAMAVNAVQKKAFVGQKMTSVREKMGDPDSYFFSDTIYAYKMTNQKNATDESWHLVFIADKELDKVADVKIHKKCCYPTPPWAK